MPLREQKIGLVLSGGGVRGAYQAGVLHYIRTKLPKEISKKIRFDVLCGSSVGAINVCFLAATSHDPEYQGQMAYELWQQLKQENIYRRGMGSMTKLASRTFTGIFKNIFFGGKNTSRLVDKTYFKGFLDSSPFPRMLSQLIPWQQIRLNIQNGSTKALSVTATNVHTGKMELFVERHKSICYTGRHPAHFVDIDVQHATASAAIPILFPSIRIGRHYYCDGGLRLNTPISPAIQLGADKIFVIGLHHASERAKTDDAHVGLTYDIPPSMGEMLGQVLKTLFVDRLDYDIIQLNRINQIIDTAEAVYGTDFLHRMNNYLTSGHEQKDIAQRGIKKIEVMSLFPSRDVRQIFYDTMVHTNEVRKYLTTFEKMLLKMLDVDLKNGLDFLTFIMFSPPFINGLLELGFEDARAKHDELISFLSTD